ncbi:hypothetical protein MCOR27_003705 [Pyricularia oryzae]|uniref:L-type lectin-like domain-containing protein n=5 Tax=Pyricularia TaxID=48558 RepID=A0ABQ8N8K2_PYRGI|nr:uncharacterized protein MGG_05685 [Pyricularia oryzae 70-15]ELQ37809.1 hypothetical protein OOU_Y34scaffold00576g21 [Pyricularia oryzae Y34]KAH8845190.1 hypothetical protein MCOR01_002437 [Pyricularia oryzae]KAI6293009.1 hypothetical protein MCOR33_009431 [Pyricularia grisea]EHA57972.1 hypothetical protein MGG_05685 [Pyricularia oryzae 70-15]KAH9428958.1 hypothetical protein MCOR02_010376 [Pyricularia oryzae]
MHFRSSLAWSMVASATQVQAQYLLNDMSFGVGSKISENGHTIPNFSTQGNPRLPELLSNKLILTPPAPGNQRGAVWTDKELHQDEWVTDVSFRVNGPERGGGNMNIWMVRDGSREVGTSSIYTVGHFEGLALVVDTYGGSGGMIRGFLNDGSTDYRSAHVDGLAFAHCNYAYRNLGRPSEIKVTQTQHNFRVDVDSSLCFESTTVGIPGGYKVGVTAASADNPDSVELFKVAVLSHQVGKTQDHHDDHHDAGHDNSHAHDDHGAEHDNEKAHTPSKFSRGHSEPEHGSSHAEHWDEDIPDESASKYTSSKAQFEDLHNRLQSVSHHLSTIFKQVTAQHSMDEHRHEETSSMINDVKTALGKLHDIDSRMHSLEQEVRSIRADLSHKVQTSENNIRTFVGDTHFKTVQTVQKHAAPGHSRLIFVIIASQLLLVVGYGVYKRRKASMPKKYL